MNDTVETMSLQEELPPCRATFEALGILPPHDGVHHWLPRAAWKCRNFGLNPSQAIDLLARTESFLRAGRNYKPNEVESAVAFAYGENATKRQPMPWDGIEWDPSHTASIHADLPCTVADLRAASPVEVAGLTVEDFIDCLFPADALICCGQAVATPVTGSRESWRGRLTDMRYVSPCRMTALTGLSKDGKKKSARTLANTGARLFAVVDLDEPPPEQHPSILWHLAQYASLHMVVSTGGKGLHGWYRPEDLERFYRYALKCGADKAFWSNRSQFARMPGGIRENGNLQEVILFNHVTQ